MGSEEGECTVPNDGIPLPSGRAGLVLGACRLLLEVGGLLLAAARARRVVRSHRAARKDRDGRGTPSRLAVTDRGPNNPTPPHGFLPGGSLGDAGSERVGNASGERP